MNTGLIYKVITEHSIGKLMDSVNAAGLDGYEPVGGVAISYQDEHDGTGYMQAVIKRLQEPE